MRGSEATKIRSRGSPVIKTSDFYRQRHRALYLKAFDGQQVVIFEALAESAVYLVEIVNNVVLFLVHYQYHTQSFPVPRHFIGVTRIRLVTFVPEARHFHPISAPWIVSKPLLYSAAGCRELHYRSHLLSLFTDLSTRRYRRLWAGQQQHQHS